MKVLIIEDEQYTAQRLLDLIKKYDPKIEVCAMLTSVQESVKWFKANTHPDLIFQDIQLSDGNCFEIYEAVKVSSPIIFTTAYSEYALKSFEVNSIDYLVKPYDYIERVLDKFSQFASMFQMPDISIIKDLINKTNISSKKRFLIRVGDVYKTLETKDVAYILFDTGLAFVYTFSGKRYPLDQSLSELEKELNPDDFYRINRKYIISSQSIQKISTWFSGRLKLQLKPEPEEDIIVSRERVNGFKKWLNN